MDNLLYYQGLILWISNGMTRKHFLSVHVNGYSIIPDEGVNFKASKGYTIHKCRIYIYPS